MYFIPNSHLSFLSLIGINLLFQFANLVIATIDIPRGNILGGITNPNGQRDDGILFTIGENSEEVYIEDEETGEVYIEDSKEVYIEDRSVIAVIESQPVPGNGSEKIYTILYVGMEKNGIAEDNWYFKWYFRALEVTRGLEAYMQQGHASFKPTFQVQATRGNASDIPIFPECAVSQRAST